MKFNIEEFIKESNAIEGIYDSSEVKTSMNAWEYLKGIHGLTKASLLETHRLIMEHLDPEIAGKFRTCDVQVGNDVKIPWRKVAGEVEFWLTQKPSSAISCLLLHQQFEDIHPFEDGNGRTGRIIYARQCLDLDLIPLMFREQDKWGYYSLWKVA